MVFSSVTFLFYFLPSVLILYFLAHKNNKLKNIILLIFSLAFYLLGGIKSFPLIIISIVFNYGMGMLVGENKISPNIKKALLIVAVIGNIGLLFYYKYFMFFQSIYNKCAEIITFLPKVEVASITLPIGISFFTFQGLSYVIDVYRGTVNRQKNIGKIALYISLFPQLIAGPIVRYSDIELQIDNRDSSIDNITEGILRFIYGLGKKVILADVLAETADTIFEINTSQINVAMAWLGAIAYTLQIYFDFSGYSDMAIGLGKIMGFDFPENFNLPYISKSVREFWRRWHITLSSWFKDYLYIPLGGNRTGNTYFNLLIVFLCTGIWHGAAVSFIVWGLWHGMFLIIERIISQKTKISIPGWISWIYTGLVVIIGWVIFRIDSMELVLQYLKSMFGIGNTDFNYMSISYFLNTKNIIIFIIAILLSLGVPKLIMNKIKNAELLIWLDYLRFPFAIIIFGISLVMVINGNYSPFIYFRF